jgi:hypothetical protein
LANNNENLFEQCKTEISLILINKVVYIRMCSFWTQEASSDILYIFLFAEDAQLSTEWVKPLTSVILKIKYLTSYPSACSILWDVKREDLHACCFQVGKKLNNKNKGITVSAVTLYHQIQRSLLHFHQINYECISIRDNKHFANMYDNANI